MDIATVGGEDAPNYTVGGGTILENGLIKSYHMCIYIYNII